MHTKPLPLFLRNFELSYVIAVAMCASLCVPVARADVFDFVEATDNATVQVAGPRSGTSGKNFLNIEANRNGNFASFGVAEFTIPNLGAQSISQITLRFTESDASFTTNGVVNLWFTTDNSTDIQSGSGLHYDNTSLPDGIGSQLASLDFLGTGSFDSVGSANTGMTDTYAITPSSGINDSAFDLLKGLANEGGLLRMVVSPGDDQVAATWAGFSNSSLTGPELSFEYVPVPEPSTNLIMLTALGLAVLAFRNRDGAKRMAKA